MQHDCERELSLDLGMAIGEHMNQDNESSRP
jgi:hypothetical protein